MSEEMTAAKVKMRKNGVLYVGDGDSALTIGKYDRVSGHLEYEQQSYASKYHSQVVARIGTVSEGTQPSQFTIKTIGVKGVAAEKPKSPRPRMGKQGDLTPEVVKWYLENNMTEAIVRYGIYTDEKGNPIRKEVRRRVELTEDNRDTNQDDLEQVKDGPRSWTKAPVNRTYEWVEKENQIIARRSSEYTFTPQEVIGGFQPDDDEAMPAIVEEQE